MFETMGGLAAKGGAWNTSWKRIWARGQRFTFGLLLQWRNQQPLAGQAWTSHRADRPLFNSIILGGSLVITFGGDSGLDRL